MLSPDLFILSRLDDTAQLSCSLLTCPLSRHFLDHLQGFLSFIFLLLSPTAQRSEVSRSFFLFHANLYGDVFLPLGHCFRWSWAPSTIVSAVPGLPRPLFPLILGSLSHCFRWSWAPSAIVSADPRLPRLSFPLVLGSLSHCFR